MAKQQLAAFAGEYLAQHPELKAKLDALQENDFVANVVALGNAAGYDFTGDDVRDAVRRHRQELTENDLEAVSGGARQQTYLQVKLTNALVVSYDV